MAKSIYKFEVDCGRMGSLQGTFTAEPEDIAFAVGKTVYFDEPTDTAAIAPAADARTLMAVNGAAVLLLGLVQGRVKSDLDVVVDLHPRVQRGLGFGTALQFAAHAGLLRQLSLHGLHAPLHLNGL